MCIDMHPHVQLYIDRELAFADRRAFEEHMAVCAVCRRATLWQLSFIAGLRARLAPPTPSPAQRRRILRFIDEQIPPEKTWATRLWASLV